MSSLFGIGGGGNVGASGSFYGFSIENSVRMSDASNSQLYWQAGTASSDYVWTMSLWMKKYDPAGGQASNEFFSAGPNGVNYMFISMNSNQRFYYNQYGSQNLYWGSGRQFRDPNAWFHLVLQANSQESTQADRLKLWLNGVDITSEASETSISTSVFPYINQSGYNQYYGGASGVANGNPGCNYYLADINFCDGQSYDASYFGEFNNGIWVPKDPSVTYGNNGYRLEFKQTGTGGASASTIGADTSGNDNHFTDSGLAASDVVSDSPTSNWATMNPLYAGVGITYYEGNLKLSASSGFSTTAYGSQSTIAIPKDKKVYIEIEETVTEGNVWSAGIATANDKPNSTLVGGPQSITVYNRQVYVNGVENDYGASAGLGGLGSTRLQAGDILGIAVDGSTGEVWFAQNNSWFKTPTTNDSGTVGDPSAGTNPIGTISNPKDEDLFLVVSGNGASNIWINFGQDTQNIASAESDANELGTFEYAPPTDHVCLATPSLTEPAIGPNSTTTSDEHFNTVLYTGDGTTSNAITGVGFQPDFVWIKRRNNANPHFLNDSVRGATKDLNTSGTDTETTNNQYGILKSFDSDGFTVSVGSTNGARANTSGGTFAAWNWKAGGTAVSNTDGSITTSVSTNTDAGISIIKYTGNGTNGATIGHNLGVTPDHIIIKRTSSTEAWVNWHQSFSATQYLRLYLTNAVDTATTLFNSTSPSSSVITLGTGGFVNTSSEDYICYAFAEKEGFSKFGTYVGNGSADGTFIYTGFRPAWVMIKRTDTTGSWNIADAVRSPDNEVDEQLQPNLSNAESTSFDFDFTSNGFKARTTDSARNASGGNYIYLAFAEAPFKYANAR